MKIGKFTPNPALASFLGLCPLVGSSSSFADGLVIATIASIGALILRRVAHSSQDLVPERLSDVFTLCIASFYAMLSGLCIDAWSPTISADLGFYVPLVMVNCLVLHGIRQGLVNDNRRFGGAFMSLLSYLFVAMTLSSIREIFGRGTLSLPTPGISPARLVIFHYAPFPILSYPMGGFMVLALVTFFYRLVLSASGRRVA